MTINRQREVLSGFPTLIFPGNNQGIELSQLMPDLWPELEAASEEMHVPAHDRWLQQADPLLSRSLPVPAFAHIVLTRDFQEPVRTYINSPFILLDSSGSANVSIFVEHSWQAGRHIIEGEDSISHYTASTSLQIIRVDPLISLE
jgi:hypothetical protein